MSGPQRDALVDAVFGEGRMSLADAAAAVDVVIAAGWRPPTEPTALPTAERAGDAGDDVAAAAERLIASRLSWGTHSDRWANPAWQREFWTEAAQIALAAQPAAVPDPAGTLRAAIEALCDFKVMQRAMYGAASDPDGVLRLSAVAAVHALRAVLGDPDRRAADAGSTP